MIELVVFDLDGTLVDTPTGIVRAFGETFDRLGVPRAAPDAIRATVGRPLATAFGVLLALEPSNELVTEAVRVYQQAFAEIVLPVAETLVFDGVAVGLRNLRNSGLRLAVATSKFVANAEALLVAAGVRAEFELVVGADQVSRPKPDPEMGRYVVSRTRVRPEQSVMVGDTTHDVLMARGAGMASIAVTYGVHTRSQLQASAPTLIADDFEGVCRLLQPRTAVATR